MEGGRDAGVRGGDIEDEDGAGEVREKSTANFKKKKKTGLHPSHNSN